MKLVICQGTPVVPNRALDGICDRADFFLAVNMGSGYVPGSCTTVMAKRCGVAAGEDRIPVPQIPPKGVLRLLALPVLLLSQAVSILRALRRWPDARDACYIGRTYLFAAVGVVARRMGLVRKVVFWVGDYYPVAGNLEIRLTHVVAQAIHRFAVRRSDETWYMSEKMSDLHRDRQGRRWRREGERVVYYAFPSFSEVHQLWDPRQPHTFVFVGFVKFGQGLEVLLRAIAMLRGLWPDVHLDVIGTGPDLDAARDLARSLSLGSCVEFHGFLPDAEMHLKVARAAAGAALFDPRVAVHSAYTVSSKAFLYVGCGTPVVINRGTGSYEDIVGAQAGVGVEYTPDSVADGLRRVASTADANRKFREAARRMAGVAGKNAEALTLAVKECAS